jgi:hypothetical protein
MPLDTSKLVPYQPTTYPTLTDGIARYFTKEFRKIADAITSVDEVLAAVASGASGIFLQTANNLSDLASAVTARTNLGLGTIATHAATEFATVANNLSDLASAATARTNLGVLASAAVLAVANNLSDLANAATARTNLGVSTAGHTGAYADLTGLPTLGTAAALNAGTAVNNLVQMVTGPKLPAVDGSALTNLPAPGQPIPTSSTFPVGCLALCLNSGASTANGATIAGSSLTLAFWSGGSLAILGAGTQTGTWKNVSGTTSNFGDANLFVRTV